MVMLVHFQGSNKPQNKDKRSILESQLSFLSQKKSDNGVQKEKKCQNKLPETEQNVTHSCTDRTKRAVSPKKLK